MELILLLYSYLQPLLSLRSAGIGSPPNVAEVSQKIGFEILLPKTLPPTYEFSNYLTLKKAEIGDIFSISYQNGKGNKIQVIENKINSTLSEGYVHIAQNNKGKVVSIHGYFGFIYNDSTSNKTIVWHDNKRNIIINFYPASQISNDVALSFADSFYAGLPTPTEIHIATNSAAFVPERYITAQSNDLLLIGVVKQGQLKAGMSTIIKGKTYQIKLIGKDTGTDVKTIDQAQVNDYVSLIMPNLDPKDVDELIQLNQIIIFDSVIIPTSSALLISIVPSPTSSVTHFQSAGKFTVDDGVTATMTSVIDKEKSLMTSVTVTNATAASKTANIGRIQMDNGHSHTASEMQSIVLAPGETRRVSLSFQKSFAGPYNFTFWSLNGGKEITVAVGTYK